MNHTRTRHLPTDPSFHSVILGASEGLRSFTYIIYRKSSIPPPLSYKSPTLDVRFCSNPSLLKPQRPPPPPGLKYCFKQKKNEKPDSQVVKKSNFYSLIWTSTNASFSAEVSLS